jgi:excinuclease UvrABC nuclease subunit
MQWVSKHISDQRIVTTSAFVSLKKCDTIKDNAGVYLFVDKDQDVKFIGKAGDGEMIAAINKAINETNKTLGTVRLKALYTDSDESALSLKKDLLGIYRPANNFK